MHMLITIILIMLGVILAPIALGTVLMLIGYIAMGVIALVAAFTPKNKLYKPYAGRY